LNTLAAHHRTSVASCHVEYARFDSPYVASIISLHSRSIARLTA
jgi:hypothetical protein